MKTLYRMEEARMVEMNTYKDKRILAEKEWADKCLANYADIKRLRDACSGAIRARR